MHPRDERDAKREGEIHWILLVEQLLVVIWQKRLSLWQLLIAIIIPTCLYSCQLLDETTVLLLHMES